MCRIFMQLVGKGLKLFYLELIITSGGENIAPVPIEDRIKAAVPFLSNIMLIGDKRKYLSCVVTIKVATLLVLACP